MKVIKTVVVFDQGGLIDSKEWAKTHSTYTKAIRAMVHPEGSKKFVIRRRTSKKDSLGARTSQWNRNGVTAIKQQFLEKLKDLKWQMEEPLNISSILASSQVKNPKAKDLFIEYPSKKVISEPLHISVGDIDCYFKLPNSFRAAIEWETGNISSSHRSMNKLCLALMTGQVEIGVLVVPSRKFYPHLTDRIGNWMELSPYLHFWKKVGGFVSKGILAVTVVEQDELTDNPKVPYIRQGTAGRSAEGSAKIK
ncbi:MAG: hypothetical protein JWQ71_4484 [Pedosphaera sp.]|nr:hypothetical protein [Pedosphaera sp.]